MKIIHISDLHIGRRFEDVSLHEDQKYIFDSMLQEIAALNPDVLLIAGDIYDKISPSAESFQLWDEMLNKIAHLRCETIIISGNHDSNDRLGVGSLLLKEHKIHLISHLKDALNPIVIQDSFGTVNFYPVPFFRPVDLRNTFDDCDKTSYTESYQFLIDALNLDLEQRNVLIAHQFFINQGTLPTLSDSEVISVGGLDAIDVSLIEDFDYCALGHIHGPQMIKKETIRYSGSPLKYSFSEVNHKKGMVFIELFEKGRYEIKRIEVPALNDVRIIKGPLQELLEQGRLNRSHDYIKAIITDEDTVYDPIAKLRSVYPNVLNIELQNSRTQVNERLKRADTIIEKSHLERFNDLYFMQNNEYCSDEALAILQNIIESETVDETH